MAKECPCERLMTYAVMLRRTFTLNYLAFLLMRLTGIALAIYLFLHIWSILQVQKGEAAFDAKMASYNTPVGWMLEYLLLLAVAYHLFNGVRIIAADFFHLTKRQAEMLWAVGASVVAIAGACLFVFFPGLDLL